MRPHGRAAGKEERQCSDAPVVVCEFQITVHNSVGGGACSCAVEIHQQEGEIIECIDIAEFVIELDSVEQHRLPVPYKDIVQVQIAMTAAYETACFALIKSVRALQKDRRCGPAKLFDHDPLKRLAFIRMEDLQRVGNGSRDYDRT